jgi:light-harvesting complex 1 alpha chain
MHRVWQKFDHTRMLPVLAIFLFTLAILIHFILLSTDRYNWLDGPAKAPVAAAAAAAAPTATP